MISHKFLKENLKLYMKVKDDNRFFFLVNSHVWFFVYHEQFPIISRSYVYVISQYIIIKVSLYTPKSTKTNATKIHFCYFVLKNIAI